MYLLKNLLLLLSIFILLFSLWPIRRLISELPPGKTRRRWGVLSSLVGLFIFGYATYAFIDSGFYRSSMDLIVPAIFFFGAVFVFLVTTLALQTTNDIKRIFDLEHESTTDPLMGICNRRYMEKRLRKEFQSAKRYKHPLSLVMIDIDHFKKINDRWGHQVGDIVLKNLADLVVDGVRECDVVCRYGGEELLVILPHTKGEPAMIIAEKLRLKIEKCEIPVGGGNRNSGIVTVTASFGVSSLYAKIDSVHSLLGQADKALYFAKKMGRNKTISCADLQNSDKC